VSAAATWPQARELVRDAALTSRPIAPVIEELGAGLVRQMLHASMSTLGEACQVAAASVVALLLQVGAGGWLRAYRSEAGEPSVVAHSEVRMHAQQAAGPCRGIAHNHICKLCCIGMYGTEMSEKKGA
jgi:hypothetical protein